MAENTTEPSGLRISLVVVRNVISEYGLSPSAVKRRSIRMLKPPITGARQRGWLRLLCQGNRVGSRFNLQPFAAATESQRATPRGTPEPPPPAELPRTSEPTGPRVSDDPLGEAGLDDIETEQVEQPAAGPTDSDRTSG